MDLLNRTQESETILEDSSAFLVGTSLYNSYFTQEKLNELIRWISVYKKRTIAVVTDLPVIHNLIAIGKTEAYAKKKVRRHGRNMELRCERAVSQTESSLAQVYCWDKFVGHQAYQQGLEKMSNLYVRDANFAQCARDMTQQVLNNKLGVYANDEEVEIAVNFLLEELAFLCWSDDILGEDSVAYIYHQEMVIFSKLIRGEFDIEISSNVHHLVVC
ncbi:MAG: tRNA-dependent cyclodipeptide synthase [Candidatus Pacebacteria bacterium]|nr:tRNA-dependent cyclodipeptide synthase [Candidatus Paceibacterota bacterium]